MRMLLHCCHGEVMWPKSVARAMAHRRYSLVASPTFGAGSGDQTNRRYRPWRSRTLERSAHAQWTIDNGGTINLLASLIRSFHRYSAWTSLLSDLSQLSSCRNKLIRSRGVATALHRIWCTILQWRTLVTWSYVFRESHCTDIQLYMIWYTEWRHPILSYRVWC